MYINVSSEERVISTPNSFSIISKNDCSLWFKKGFYFNKSLNHKQFPKITEIQNI